MLLSGGTDHPADLSAGDSGRYSGACPKGEPIRLPPKGRGAGVGRGEVEAILV
jgi:hypothetical protein